MTTPTQPDAPKIQHKRKLGHLWQVAYGSKRRQFYGYGAIQATATAQAKQRWKKASQ